MELEYWLIYFHDKSVAPEVLTDEDAARARLADLSQNWNVDLFAPLTRIDALQAEIERLKAQIRKQRAEAVRLEVPIAENERVMWRKNSSTETALAYVARGISNYADAIENGEA